jgi:hypothetical protein
LISEEAGEAHLVKNGRITTNLNESELVQSLTALLNLSQSTVDLPRRVRSWFNSSGSKNNSNGEY